MSAIEKLLGIASNEVGYLEKKNGNSLYDKTANAGSANYTKYGYEMHKLYPTTMDYPAAWCDCFVDWCFVQAFGKDMAVKMLHKFDDYTVNSAGYFKNNKEWYKTPKVGDQIFFTDSKGSICHTGLVYAVDKTNVYTIEGNTSSASGVVANGGCVAKKSYKLNYSRIAGYGRPNYNLVEQKISTSIVEYEKTEEILWELLHRKIITNEKLWRDYINKDTNVYWLCRKIIHYVRTKSVSERADKTYTNNEEILWELSHRKIITDINLWRNKIASDQNIYWLCQKAVHYMRTQKKEI